MHLIITDTWFTQSQPRYLSGSQVAVALAAFTLGLMLISGSLYHLVLAKGAREGWPVVGSLVRGAVKDEFHQRDRYVRENVDSMARRLGEMQAKLVQLEALTERVSQLAGIPIPASGKSLPGRGGALVGDRPLTVDELQQAMSDLERISAGKADALTVMESRLFDQRLEKIMLPTSQPVPGSHMGSGFGWRIDPINGRSALHTGLDFQAEQGTPILAAAGGVVLVQEYHPAYGNMVEIDHGNDLISRYAHASEVFVKKGDLVKRGQKIASVGSTGRSTGPHLHFEVWVGSSPQDPQRFLSMGATGVLSAQSTARAVK